MSVTSDILGVRVYVYCVTSSLALTRCVRDSESFVPVAQTGAGLENWSEKPRFKNLKCPVLGFKSFFFIVGFITYEYHILFSILIVIF